MEEGSTESVNNLPLCHCLGQSLPPHPQLLAEGGIDSVRVFPRCSSELPGSLVWLSHVVFALALVFLQNHSPAAFQISPWLQAPISGKLGSFPTMVSQHPAVSVQLGAEFLVQHGVMLI